MANEELKLRIEELELELKTTKVNKKTEGSVGLLKAKIAKLKDELEIKSSKSTRGAGYAVKKEGDATVGLLGKPSVGKSTLLSKITNKESKIGAYEFTTLNVIPGLLHHKHTNLQILDLPGIIDKASDNRGFGKKVLSVVRVCDLVVFIINAKDISEMQMLLTETYNSGIRINKIKPFIQIKRTYRGGIKVPINQSKKNIPYSLIKEIMNNNKITNAEVLIHQENLIVDDLLDTIYDNLIYTKGVICLNKIDLLTKEELQQAIKDIKKRHPGFALFGVSAETDINLEEFKDFIWDELGFIWNYLKEQKKDADMEKPVVLKKGDTVSRVCSKVHKDLLLKFQHAKIKGKSVKFDWQRVGLNHVVEDCDIVEIITK